MSKLKSERIHRVFKDQALQQQLLYKGYFTMPLLTLNQVNRCLEIYNQSDGDRSNKKYNSLEVQDYDHRLFVKNELSKVFEHKVLGLLDDYRFLGFNFAVKKSGVDTQFNAHIDDVHADEDKYVSVNVWIPLVDVRPENGALWVVPFSHKVRQPLSGIRLPYPFSEYEHVIEDHKVFLNLRAGEAMFFHTRLAHGSGSNLTAEDRPAIISGTVPKEAETFVYMSGEPEHPEMVIKYEANDDFFLGADISKQPEGIKRLDQFEYTEVHVSETELREVLSGGGS